MTFCMVPPFGGMPGFTDLAFIGRTAKKDGMPRTIQSGPDPPARRQIATSSGSDIHGDGQVRPSPSRATRGIESLHPRPLTVPGRPRDEREDRTLEKPNRTALVMPAISDALPSVLRPARLLPALALACGLLPRARRAAPAVPSTPALAAGHHRSRHAGHGAGGPQDRRAGLAERAADGQPGRQRPPRPAARRSGELGDRSRQAAPGGPRPGDRLPDPCLRRPGGAAARDGLPRGRLALSPPARGSTSTSSTTGGRASRAPAAGSPASSPASIAGCRRTPLPRWCSATPSAASSRATR